MANVQNTYNPNDTRYSPRDDNSAYAPTPAEVLRTTLLNRISWGAVFSGVVIAFAVQLILNLLGLGLGFATLDTVAGTGMSSYEFSWAGAMWWTVAGLIASAAGGFAAGRLAGEPKFTTSAWHGLISWATSILVMAVLMASTAGATARMTGPFQIAMDRENAVVYPGATMARSDNMAAVSPSTRSTGDSSTYAADTPVIDSDVIAAASLASAIALMLGAIAAWMGGRAGTVKNLRLRDDMNRPVHS